MGVRLENGGKARLTFPRGELAVAGLITFASVVLHIWFFVNAGGLWRDEAGGVALASMPTFAEMCRWLTHDSFPALFPSVLRAWLAVGLGATDLGLRSLGFLVGLSLVGTLWWNARVFGLRAPLVSLSLLATSLVIVRWGDSLRAYGLGCVLILAFVNRAWALICQPSTARALVVAVVGVLCVQCLYQNAFLLGAVCLSGTIVCLRWKQKRTAWLTLATALPAAISLLPYVVPLRQAQRWWIVEKVGFKPAIIGRTLLEATSSPPWLGPVIWILILVATCGIGIATLEKRVNRHTSITAGLPLFCGVAALMGVGGFFIFVAISGLPTQSWYWLPLLAFVAGCGEGALGPWIMRHRRWGFAAIGTIAFVSFLISFGMLKQRMTGVDLVAQHLSKNARPDDVIIVYPWFYGVSFHRYYRGSIPWRTIPDVEDHRIHRYDLLKAKLQEKDPIRSVLNQITEALASGKRVWLVGGLPPPSPGETAAPVVPPAPEGGWHDEPYNYSWGRQTSELLALRAGRLESVILPGDFTRFENVGLFVAGNRNEEK